MQRQRLPKPEIATLMLTDKATAAATKRSRVVIAQSRRGCVTCKARRVKCDENKPFCWRCVKADRLCGGYSYETVQPALRTGIRTDKHTNRLAHLALHVLSLDVNGQLLQKQATWGYCFPQLCNSAACVRAAAAAFGAAYELSLQDSLKDAAEAWRYYGLAVKQLQCDVTDDAVSPESLVIASITLACAESLSQHEQNALIHLQGASQIMDRVKEKTMRCTDANTLAAIMQELSNIGISIASHIMSEAPSFLQIEPEKPNAVCTAAESTTKMALTALQNAYRFIGAVAPRRYTYPSWTDLDLDMCRSRNEILDELRSTASTLEILSANIQSEHLMKAMGFIEAEILADIYSLRCQLILAIVFISSIHSAFETNYDRFQGLFQEIVKDAAASMRFRQRFKTGIFSRFSTRPGVLNPLFFVAMKCRDKSLRTVAINMMSSLGREGPADGCTMAAIATRLADIESSHINLNGDFHDICDVPEEQRIHGYSLQTPPSNELGCRVLRIKLSKPNPPVSKGWRQINYSQAENWAFRTETLYL